MRVVMLCRKGEDYTREAEEWVADFMHETGIEVEELDPDTYEGEHFASAHDFVAYPTVAVLGPDNVVLNHWDGRPLPQFEKVTYEMRSI
jgi:fructoselysine-6-P-deglycase FrlB-like protein